MLVMLLQMAAYRLMLLDDMLHAETPQAVLCDFATVPKFCCFHRPCCSKQAARYIPFVPESSLRRLFLHTILIW
jgi:hypothetical protein